MICSDKNFNEIKNICFHFADTGYFHPLYYYDGTFEIIPFSFLNDDNKNIVANELSKVWPEYTLDYINNTWCNTNILYTLFNKNTNTFIGTISIDRINFLPYIGSLYIAQWARRTYMSDLLISFSDYYIKKLGFNESHLWCNKDMIKFYIKKKFTIKQDSDDKIIMVKGIYI